MNEESKSKLKAIIRSIVFTRLNTDNKDTVTVSREQLHLLSAKLYDEFLFIIGDESESQQLVDDMQNELDLVEGVNGR